MLTAKEKNRTRKILALAGFIGGIGAIAIGCIFLLFALPSLGRPGELDYVFSQAAGAFLIILLGLIGILGAALAWPSRKAERALLLLGWPVLPLNLCDFSGLSGMVCMHGNPVNCSRNRGSFALPGRMRPASSPLCRPVRISPHPGGHNPAALRLEDLVGLGGSFSLQRPAPFLREDFSCLPLLSGGGGRKWGYFVYALGSLALIVLAISALAYLPGQAGPGLMGNAAVSGQSINGTAGQAELKDCDCNGRSSQKLQDSVSQK